MSYFLCGQTGNVNRGCEAIIRSTVKLLNKRNGDVYLATFAPRQDRAMADALGINLTPYEKYPASIHRYICSLWRRIYRPSLAGTGYWARGLYAHLQPGDLCLNIGGDTYCYGRPIHSLALNRFTQKKGIDNILWCCSIEKDVIRGEIREDLLRYRYIFAREQITLENLLAGGIPREKIVKVCDPAFFLEQKEVPLPAGFVPGNTVGLNVSECVIGSVGDMVYENVLHMARYILDETDMALCLIPHVYSIEKNSCDWPILTRLKKDLNSKRVSIVDREYDCEELKYIIARCRFMVCARTHASIAAYSSEVPTLVLGYSIKSKGIAMDLFGTHENYVVPYQNLMENHQLTEAFRFLEDKEEKIRRQLHGVLPAYKAQLADAVSTYIHCKRDEICDGKLCSGCGACAEACPADCITMKPDGEGFLRPAVDEAACLQCGKCKALCPAANRRPAEKNSPKVFAAIHRDEAVREKSSSGGLFSALAQGVITRGGVVFGAAFDENFDVKHTCAQSSGDLAALLGSKYVQSAIGESYKQAKDFLEAGREVLFSGTPCQIAGLHAFLDKDYEKLLAVDIICHGAPSPKIWKKHLAFREKKAGAKLQGVSFRDKSSGWKGYSLRLRFAQGPDYICPITRDPYLLGYLSHNFLRPSCHECAFKTANRLSDITLGDFWGVEDQFPERNDDRGVSLAILRTKRGEVAFEEISSHTEYWKVKYGAALGRNSSASRSAPSSPLRSAFWRDAERLEFDRLIKKYCGKSYLARARRLWAKLKG